MWEDIGYISTMYTADDYDKNNHIIREWGSLSTFKRLY